MAENLILNKILNFWRNIDKEILIIFLILFGLGIFFSFSSTSLLAGERLNKDYYYYFSRHLSFAIISIILMLFIASINTYVFKKLLFPLFFLSIVTLFLVFFIGIEVKGSKRWLDLIFFRFQPIEVVKPFFIITVARVLANNDSFSKLNYFYSFIILLIPSLMLLNQPDVGQTILLIISWGALVFVSGIKMLYIFVLGLLSIFFVGLLFFIFPSKFSYIFTRIELFFDPSKGERFQSNVALDAIRQGGLTGQGMGEGTLKDSVPEAHTDYIISVISEEFGSITSILLISLFLYLAFKVIKVSLTHQDKFIKITLCGLSSLLIFQTFIHVAVNTSLLPTTGMTLPFLSYGGSSLIGSAILAGAILNFTKKNFYEKYE